MIKGIGTLGKNYTLALKQFNEAISLSRESSDIEDYIGTVYYNRAIAKIESARTEVSKSFNS